MHQCSRICLSLLLVWNVFFIGCELNVFVIVYMQGRWSQDVLPSI